MGSIIVDLDKSNIPRSGDGVDKGIMKPGEVRS